MAFPLAILGLLPTILSLITLIEQLISKPKQGALKKELVLQILDQLVILLERLGVTLPVSWSEIRPEVEQLIDALVQLLNELGVFRHG